MTSDPAKHAETVRELLIYADSCGDEDVLRDGNELAAYLDSLPGDGGELADGHWLNTQGLGQTLDCAYGLSWQNDAGNICVCFTDTDGDAVWLQINPNRAAVRNLIAAINWELTPATGGE